MSQWIDLANTVSPGRHDQPSESQKWEGRRSFSAKSAEQLPRGEHIYLLSDDVGGRYAEVLASNDGKWSGPGLLLAETKGGRAGEGSAVSFLSSVGRRPLDKIIDTTSFRDVLLEGGYQGGSETWLERLS